MNLYMHYKIPVITDLLVELLVLSVLCRDTGCPVGTEPDIELVSVVS